MEESKFSIIKSNEVGASERTKEKTKHKSNVIESGMCDVVCCDASALFVTAHVLLLLNQ